MRFPVNFQWSSFRNGRNLSTRSPAKIWNSRCIPISAKGPRASWTGASQLGRMARWSAEFPGLPQPLGGVAGGWWNLWDFSMEFEWEHPIVSSKCKKMVEGHLWTKSVAVPGSREFEHVEQWCIFFLDFGIGPYAEWRWFLRPNCRSDSRSQWDKDNDGDFLETGENSWVSQSPSSKISHSDCWWYVLLTCHLINAH